MGRKKKIGVLAIILALVLFLPMAGLIFQPTMVLEEADVITPVKSFTESADAAVDTAASGIVTLHDTDNLYGGNYATYTLKVNTTFASEGTNIDNITIEFWTAAGVLFSFLYDNDTEAVTEVTNPTYVTLGAYSNLTTGAYANLTIAFTVDWLCPDTDNVDVNITAFTSTNSTESTKDANYDFDTDLTLTSSDFLVATQAEQNDILAVNTLTYSYEDSGGDNYPLGAQTDFYVSRDASTDPDSTYAVEYFQADSYSDTTGIATWTSNIVAKGGAHTESYTLFAITQGGTAGTNPTCMGTDGTDSITILDHPPRDGDDGIGEAIADNTTTIIVVGVGGVLIGTLAYLYMGKGASYGKVGRKGTRSGKRKPLKRKKSMNKSSRRRKR